MSREGRDGRAESSQPGSRGPLRCRAMVSRLSDKQQNCQYDSDADDGLRDEASTLLGV